MRRRIVASTITMLAVEAIVAIVTVVSIVVIATQSDRNKLKTVFPLNRIAPNQ